MNANDLYDWKRHPVTQAVFNSLVDRIQGYVEYLIANDGSEPDKVARFKGAIQACRDILNTEYSDITEEETQ